MHENQRVIAIASILEGATGIALLVTPSLVVSLLFDAEPSDLAAIIGRIAGIALLSLAIACWPDVQPKRGVKPYGAMLAYNALTASMLAWVGLTRDPSGFLLWPTVLLHAILAILLAREMFRNSLAAYSKR
jgi:hypothetical protein